MRLVSFISLSILLFQCHNPQNSVQDHLILLNDEYFGKPARFEKRAFFIYEQDTIGSWCSCYYKDHELHVRSSLSRIVNNDLIDLDQAFVNVELILDKKGEGTYTLNEASKIEMPDGNHQHIETSEITVAKVDRSDEIDEVKGVVYIYPDNSYFFHNEVIIHFKCVESSSDEKSAYGFFDHPPHDVLENFDINSSIEKVSNSKYVNRRNYYYVENDSTFYLHFTSSTGYSGESFFLRVINRQITSSYTFGTDVPNEFTELIYDFEYHQLTLDKDPLISDDTISGKFIFVSDPEPNLYGKVFRKEGYFEARRIYDTTEIPFFYLEQKIN